MDEKVEPKFYVVCEHCFHNNSKNPTVEFNFKEQSIHYVCPECRKRSKMTLKSNTPMPFPKTKLI
jgi:hypothetical protein